MIKEVILQTRPKGADVWDPGVTCVLEGCDTQEEAIRYVMAKADETATKFRAEQAKKKRLEKAQIL